jgi:APA family basic amino acid/polyamine antiporter
MSTSPSAVSLKRDLGLWSAVAIVVGTVIGSGIFIVPNVMIRNMGTPGMVFVVWVVGGVMLWGFKGILLNGKVVNGYGKRGHEYRRGRLESLLHKAA